MNFAGFLEQRRKNLNLSTVKAHYEELGGFEKLGITVRHFQQISSGARPPTDRFLAVLLGQIGANEKKVAVLAYFHSTLEKCPDERSALLEYLEQYLFPAMDQEKKSIWQDSRQRQMMFSEEQLKYLASNAEALRLHQRISLFDRVEKEGCRVPAATQERMADLDLIRIDEKELLPSTDLYRIPTFENSGPRAVALGTDYILKFLDIFVSREGSPRQELHCTMQLIDEAHLPRIIEQVRNLKHWIQSLSSSTQSEKAVRIPLLFAGLAKGLDKRELS